MTSARAELSIARKLAFSVIAMLMGLLLLEVAARWAEPHLFPSQRTIPTPGPARGGESAFSREIAALRQKLGRPAVEKVPIAMVPNAALGWSLPPGQSQQAGGVYYRYNAMGLRGPPLGPPKPGEIRLMTLGDSSVFGDSVREDAVFSSVAAAALSRAWLTEVVGVNGATPGHDSSQSYTTLSIYGPQIHPQWVIICNLWSDLYRKDGHGVDAARVYLPLQQQLQALAMYRGLHRLLSPWLQSRQVRWIDRKEDIGSSRAGTESRVPLKQYLENLRRIAALATKLEAQPAFVVLPAPMDFDQVPPPDSVQEYRLAMRRVAQQLNAPLVDGPAVLKARGADITYFLDQVHPNADGHRILGEALAEVLMPLGPLPKEAGGL